MHVFFWPENGLLFCFWFTEIERLGEVGRWSIENRTEGEEDEAVSGLRFKKPDDSEEKLEMEEDMDEEQNRPEGEIDLWKL